jgi:hypothetical protein
MIARTAVSMRVRTEGVPAGTAARIRIHDGDALLLTLDGLVVRGDAITADGATPTWAASEDLGVAWSQGRYTYEAEIDYGGGLRLRSGELKIVSMIGDLGDPDLQARQELEQLAAIVAAVPGHMACLSYIDKNASVERWQGQIGRAFAYHHVSHGNLRCRQHAPARCFADDGRRFLPAYPWCCSTEVGRIEGLRHRYDVALAAALEAERQPGFADVVQRTARYDDAEHTFEAVMQWVGVDDSSTDVCLGATELADAAPRQWPRVVFLDSCMLGWERSLARCFLDHGAVHVIAFRCRVVGGDGVAMARDFYRRWAAAGLALDAVPAAFTEASADNPRAEPVLFSADAIRRRVWTGQVRGAPPFASELRQHAWDDDGFFTPSLLEDRPMG